MTKYKSSIVPVAVWCFLFTSGCFGWVRGEAGLTTSTRFENDRVGGSFGLEMAVGKEREPLAFDVALRGKVTEKAGDFGAFMGALSFYEPKPVAGYVLLGAYLFQVGSVENHVSFGMFSPAAEAGITFVIPGKPTGYLSKGNGTMLTLGTRIEYDLRFTSQKNEGFWTFNLGYAFGVGH